MLSFDNTENAFKSKTNSDMRRSYWLFKLIGNPSLVNLGASLGPMALNVGLKGLIKSTIFKQFVGGENIEDCTNTINELAKYHIGSILDYSVEGKESEKDFEHGAEETMATIRTAKKNPNIPFSVFKVTGMARRDLLEKVSSKAALNESESAEWQRVKDRVGRICQLSYEYNQPLFIDAEESWIQPAIDEMVDENMERFNKEKPLVHNTFQLYRHDRCAFLNESIQRGKSKGYQVGAKLVRGAYMEKERERALKMNYPSPIHETKEACDADYDRALKLCVDNINMMSLCAGTHNEKSSAYLVQLMKDKNIAHNDKRIYFSQLLGMSDHISFNLAADGYNVVKYVPYGPVREVLPYLIRRAQENTSVKGQTGRELKLIMTEKKRRASLN
ncbi:MAG TPA: proline dehydrogenase family protein [Bacteroidia bacterium]|nr:proline dehydrogenase family protein [Bacteroidia bacterium]